MIRRWTYDGEGRRSAYEIVRGYRGMEDEYSGGIRRLREYFDRTHSASEVLEDYASEEDFWKEMAYSAEDMAASNPTMFAAISGYYTEEPVLRITMDTPVRLAFAARYPDEYAIPNMDPTITFRDFEKALRKDGNLYDQLRKNPEHDRGVTDTMNRESAFRMWAEAMGMTVDELDEYCQETVRNASATSKKPQKTQKPAKGKTKTASSQRKPARKPQAKVSTASGSPKGAKTKRRRR